MHSRNGKLFVAVFAVLLAFVLQSATLYGQTKQLLAWRAALAGIHAGPASEIEAQRDSVLQIRTGIEFWLRLHPNTAIKLDAAPAQP
jgi:hypothetical protein